VRFFGGQASHLNITVAFKVELPEIFTMSDQDYEALHHSLIKAIKVLPKYTVLHKQDWFTEAKYTASFEKQSFLSRSSERFFNERPYLDHSCYVLLTKKPNNRKASSSLFSNLLKRSIVPEEVLDPKHYQDFLNSIGQFKGILEDSGLVSLDRLDDLQLEELVMQFLTLDKSKTIKDIEFCENIRVGENHLQLFTLADAEHLPAVCGSRINFDKYSTDKTKFSVGFASPLGQLLSCNHIYNQYVFIEDANKIIQRLEGKKLRLQSLSAYSRENLIAKQATDGFLNEAIAEQRLPVKVHFNIITWTDNKDKLKDVRNITSAAIAQMDAVPKIETAGAPQIYWAALPGNAADFPMNEAFDTFSPQACCFLNLETNYRSSFSPVGLRLGDRLNGVPVHVDISDEPLEKGICTNRNKFILGPSGSGKSFFTNHMVRSY
jgi:conjugation system TraG family ATPase